MSDYSRYREISPTAYADGLPRSQFVDIDIRELWPQVPRIAGPAYTVRCAPGDNLMLHAAIYRAARGSVIVVEAGSSDYAMSGGNVCAI
ncbi:MAG: RraA family protein, partial [Cyanobacteria bacterium J06588_5]